MLPRIALAALALTLCCAVPAAAAPTSITEFPAEPKVKYIEGSPAKNVVWATIEDVGIQEYATGDGEAIATARGATNIASSDLVVDVDGAVTWTLPPGIAGFQAGWARRAFSGSIVRTPVGNSASLDAIMLPSAGASPLATGRFPTGPDCIYTVAECVMPAPDSAFELTGLAADGVGRTWAVSPEANQAFRMRLGPGSTPPTW